MIFRRMLKPRRARGLLFASPRYGASYNHMGDPSRTSASTAGVDSRTEAAMAVVEHSNTVRIRTLNDVFRQTFIGGTVTLTSGVAALPPEHQAKVLTAIRTFTEFDEGNDPHREHDFV